MIRVLHFVSSININSGVMSVLMNYYRNINRDEIQFDFLYFTKDETKNYMDEIKKGGGNCFLVTPPNKDPFQFEKDIHEFYKQHFGQYYAVHLHDTFLPAFLIDCKKKLGIKKLIAHGHLTSYGDSKIKRARNRILSFPKHFIVDEFWACSHEAGYALIGKRCFDKHGRILHNAIKLDRYTFSDDTRHKIRKELELDEDAFVIGHVGHFSQQKNHDFLIRVFKHVKQDIETAKLVLIGDGVNRRIIEQQCKESSILKDVFFLGVRDNVNELLSCFDVFCFPSRYEGLPFALVEAQAVGLPCVYSDTITREVNILTEQNTVLSLDAPISEWGKAIHNARRVYPDPHTELRESGFDITEESKRIIEYYLA